MAPTINFAIAGCGNISRRHALEAARTGRLAAVCDTDTAKAHTLAQEFNCNAYASLDDMIAAEKKIDIVSICTPNYLHAPQSIQCLNNKLHVLCEKPMAISAHSARKMTDAASANAKKLFIVKQNRYNPLAIYIKKLIDDGSLGRLFSFQANCFWNRNENYYTGWRGKLNTDGDTLYTQFSHYIDLILWFFGDATTAALQAANYHHPAIEFEDTGNIIFTMQNGMMGNMCYTVNAYEKNMESSITIFGENGTVKIGGQYLNTLDYFSVAGIAKPGIAIQPPANQYGSYTGSMSTHNGVYDAVVKTLQGWEENLLQGQEGIKTVALIEDLYKHQCH